MPIIKKGTYYGTLHDSRDHSILIAQGLYLWVKDSAGGWNAMESRLSAGNITMKMEKAPTDWPKLQETLKWCRADLVKKGFQAAIPKLMTFSQLISHLVAETKIPAHPDPEFKRGDEVDSEDPEELINVAPESQSLFDVPYSQQIDEEIIDGSQAFDHEEVIIQESNADVYEDSEFNKLQRMFDELQQEHQQLQGTHSQLQADHSHLQTEHTIALDRNVQLEDRASLGHTGIVEQMQNSFKGMLESSFHQHSLTMETTWRRDMRNALSGSTQLTNLMESNKSALNTTLASVNQMYTSLDAQLHEVDKSVQNIVLGQSENRDTLSTLLMHSTQTKNRINSFGDLGKLRTSTPSSTSGSDSSLETTPRSTKPLFCTYCMKKGNHSFEVCPTRPNGYRCYRCHRENHPAEKCNYIRRPCTFCGAVGHGSLLHEVTLEADRVSVINDFGVDNFRHFFSASSTPTHQPKTQVATPRSQTPQTPKVRSQVPISPWIANGPPHAGPPHAGPPHAGPPHTKRPRPNM